MGEYGEPWSVVEQGNTVKSKRVVTAHGASVASSLARFSGWAERIAACVNALDGVPDEAIPHIRAAIVGLLSNLPIVTMEHLTQARKMMEVPNA